MAHISQQDLDVRLQLTSCELGDMTARLLAKIKIGSKDVHCKLQELQILQIMLGYIKCYDVTLVEVLATGTIVINTIVTDDTVNIKVNGISISGTYIAGSSTEATEMIALTAAINAYQDVYTAVYDAGAITITSLYCDTLLMEAVVTDAVVTVTGLTGTCLIDNCITEDDLISMFDYISKKTGICFQPMGFSYE